MKPNCKIGFYSSHTLHLIYSYSIFSKFSPIISLQKNCNQCSKILHVQSSYKRQNYEKKVKDCTIKYIFRRLLCCIKGVIKSNKKKHFTNQCKIWIMPTDSYNIVIKTVSPERGTALFFTWEKKVHTHKRLEFLSTSSSA